MTSNDFFKFELIYKSKKSRARVGRIHTPHGIIDTPCFVAVGTNGTLKALDNKTLDEMGLQLMFANTYHLILQPGSKLIAQAGGIHKFSKRSFPIITDSGGFQVFSLAYGGVAQELKSKGQKKHDSSVIKINEEGVLFRSYKDGAKILLTPETSIQAQKEIGADIIVSFDELLPYHTDSKQLLKSLDRTHRWEKRSLDEHKKNINKQALYAVLHGGVDKDLRKKSCDNLSKLDFDGFAIGGSVGKDRFEMFDMLKSLMPNLPQDKPNHLLGIGDLESIAGIVPLGIDTFDSSHPTRAARHGLLFTKNGLMRVFKSGNANIHSPIENGCNCLTCQNYSLSYVYHLFKSHEIVGLTLATIHNIYFMINLMKDYRHRILNDEI
ncbi:tRNA-guanosine(34) transglycosylase [Candidatus Dependentiae bacterium]|nr:tRNA-guanosine(34) transglycosylase [Candidatus Dependentiae bacterium]MBU4386946.1 tRNA-guanosine(34) transglycosylase [Candidatus Dependentiae bacterium]MCG2756256.1 tRNA-guanosine(34) transglycosylase [Candidatus Dependentiae bacterium]